MLISPMVSSAPVLQGLCLYYARNRQIGQSIAVLKSQMSIFYSGQKLFQSQLKNNRYTLQGKETVGF